MDDTPANLSPLEQRRAALRALSDDIMETIKTLPKPQSWLEGDRAMRCLSTADRVTVQLFTKVKAQTPAGHRQTLALSVRASAPVRAPEQEAPFVYVYGDDEIDAADVSAEDSDDGKALDTALDDMEALLDAIDRGKTPAPIERSTLPAAKPTAATSRDASYQNLTQTLARGRDLIMELAATPP